jgi:hypothetical protein
MSQLILQGDGITYPGFSLLGESSLVSVHKRIKSFCVAQPMQKLGWTECVREHSRGSMEFSVEG